MARGINKVILVGNLGNDPDVRHTQGGTSITTISVATTESWKDKSGVAQDRTEWHRVKFFGRLAEIAGEYLKKGRQVYIEGTLRTDKYTDKEGVERYSTEIIASEMQMLGSGAGGESMGQDSSALAGFSEGRRGNSGVGGQSPRGNTPKAGTGGRNNKEESDPFFGDEGIPF